MLTKFREFVKGHSEDIILAIGVVLISMLSFAMGYIAAKQQEKEPLKFETNESSYCRGGGGRALSGLEIV